MTELFQVGQLVKKPSFESADFSTFIIQSRFQILKCLIGYFITLLIVFIFKRTVYPKNRKLKLSSYELFFSDFKIINKFFSKLKYILLAFNLFLFVNLSLLSNSIKTEKVVVPTDELIDSVTKFERTRKEPCFFREENDMEVILNAPSNSFLSRVFKNKIKRKSILCHLSKKYNATEVDKLREKGLHTYFYFMKRASLLILLSYITKNANNYLLFKKSTQYYEMQYVIYVRRSLDERRKNSLMLR